MSKSCLQICTMQRLFPWKYPSLSITESSILAAVELIWTWFIVSIYFVKNKLVWIKPICLGLVSDYCNSQIPEISTISKTGFKMDCSNIPSSMWHIVTAWLAKRIMLLMGVENKCWKNCAVHPEVLHSLLKNNWTVGLLFKRRWHLKKYKNHWRNIF